MAAEQDAEQLRQRLGEGAWLTVAEVQLICGVRHRSTVHRWIRARDMRWRVASGPGGQVKQLHPEDVRALVADRDRVRQG